MPDELKARIQTAADEAGRSLHAELLYRLQNSFESDRSFEMFYELRRTQLQLQLNNLGSKVQALRWRERDLRSLIDELERSNVPAEGIDKARGELAQVLAEAENLAREDQEVMRRLLRLDDEHSDRFELWEDQVAERAARNPKP